MIKVNAGMPEVVVPAEAGKSRPYNRANESRSALVLNSGAWFTDLGRFSKEHPRIDSTCNNLEESLGPGHCLFLVK